MLEDLKFGIFGIVSTMECNKEEAIRAREIAEHKMKNDDFEGAKRLVLKAQKLFPELENIAQLLTVCNVHHCAKLKFNGSEMDWYGILQLDRSANMSSIKKQYRKLALLLHPDKNKFAGAEAAFKLIGEANAVLADQTKRSLFDMKTASKTPHPSNTASTNAGLSKSSQYDTKPAPKPTPRPSNTTSANADRTKSSQYDTKPAPKPTPRPSNTTSANADQTKSSQYGTKPAAKSTPPLSNTASANADQTKSSQSETETALKSTSHPSNTTCACADQTKSSQYDTKTAPNPTPHPLNSTNIIVGSAGRLYEPRNNNKNGYSNFTSSSSYQPTWHQTFWPPCSVYHHHYNLVHRWLNCPSCGSFIGSTNVGPQGCCWRPYGFQFPHEFAGPGPIAKAGSGSRVGDSKEEEMVNVLKKCVEMVNSNTRDLQKNIDMLWSNVRNLKKGVEMPKPNEKKGGRE